MAKDPRLQLRDEALSRRVDRLIELAACAGKKLTRSEILRAAAYEWLEKIEREGEIVTKIPPKKSRDV